MTSLSSMTANWFVEQNQNHPVWARTRMQPSEGLSRGIPRMSDTASRARFLVEAHAAIAASAQ
jgi:hypothetical protein